MQNELDWNSTNVVFPACQMYQLSETNELIYITYVPTVVSQCNENVDSQDNEDSSIKFWINHLTKAMKNEKTICLPGTNCAGVAMKPNLA